MTRGEAVAAAARATVGARFRLHGRDPATGLDCVGVAACALRAGGWSGRIPAGYLLRTGTLPQGADEGLVTCAGDRPGDIVLCRPGPGQIHLMVRTVSGAVHADAMLRRVVERPGASPWPVNAAYRLED